MILRINFYVLFEVAPIDKTDTSTYHGGAFQDEVAALAALAMGARLKAGPVSRQFDQGDMRGKPIAYFGYSIPRLLPPDERGRHLPSAVGHHSLEDLTWMEPWFEPSWETRLPC